LAHSLWILKLLFINQKGGCYVCCYSSLSFQTRDGKKIDQLIQEGFVPLLKKAKGFVRYYWLDTGKGEGASLSVFKDKAGADESVLLAADFVKQNMSNF
jgi:hypothetical protein